MDPQVTHNWIVESLEQFNDGNDTVYAVYFKLSTTYEDFEVSIYDAIELNPPQSQDFIPYSELTNDIVVGWIKSYMEEKCNYYELCNTERIKALLPEGKETTKIESLPWS